MSEPARFLPRAAAAVLLAVALVVAAVACSTETAPTSTTSAPLTGSDLEQIQQATSAAGSTHYRGAITFPDGASGPLTGASQADRQAGSATFPVSTSSGSAEGAMTWVDGMIYVRRVVVPDDVPTDAWLRHADDLPYIQIPASAMTQGLLVPYDPYTLLAYLAGSKQVAVPAGTETVDGAELQRFTVDLSQTGASIVPGARRAEVLTDEHRRLRVARLVGDDTIEYQLSDFGADVSVSAPPSDQIGQPDRRPSGEAPVGPYEQIAAGTTQGVEWKVVGAPATNGGTCWRFDTSVDIHPVAATQPDGATCLAAFDPGAPAADRSAVVVDAGDGSPFDVLLTVAPTGSTVEMSFADGSRAAVPEVAPGLYLWTGPSSPLAVLLDLSVPGAAPVACGPGPVSDLSDLEDLPPEALAQLSNLPWLCI